MLGAYYDIEIYDNFLSFIFLDITCPADLIKLYIEADKKLQSAIKFTPNDLTQINKHKSDKQAIFKTMPVKTFIFFEPRKNIVNTPSINSINELVAFVTDIKLLIGYNNLKFDDLLLDYLLARRELYLKKDGLWLLLHGLNIIKEAIFANNHTNYRYMDDVLRDIKSHYLSLDLFSMVFETVQRKSLKQALINLKWYRIQDLPIKPNSIIDINDIAPIIDYNFNDVLGTRELHLDQLAEAQLRTDLQEEYGVNVLSANRSKVADKLMAKFYQEYTGLPYYQFKDKRTFRKVIYFGDIVNPRIKFNSPTLINLHHKILNTSFHPETDKFSELIRFANKGYTLGVGGLHSVDRPYFYQVDGIVQFLRDSDVTSYYPYLIINELVCPAHLALTAYLAVVTMIVTKRVEAKHSLTLFKQKLIELGAMDAKKLKIVVEGMKIVANSGLFGKLGSQDAWQYDLKALYKTTLNGQLYLLMLIEQQEESGIEVISANTDGILCRFNQDKEEQYYRNTKAWEKFTNLTLEYTNYLKYVRTSVNDYMAVLNNNDVKRKGDFIADITNVDGKPRIKMDVRKGFDAPIVALAIDNYYRFNTPIEDIIYNHDDIYDFCISVKTGDDYIKELWTVDNGLLTKEELSKNLRYYVGLDGGTLLKTKLSGQNLPSGSNMLKGEKVVPFNDFVYVPSFKDYNIDYKYYIRRANDIILRINGEFSKRSTSRRVIVRKQHKGVTEIGRMFDNV